MAELDSQPKSIQSIYSWYSEDMLSVNRRYQRKLVWTLLEKQKLIESILRRYPVPAILLAEREGGGYEIIDGLQRLHTLVSFIEGSFPTLDGKYFDVAQFPTAQTRADKGVFTAPSGGDVIDTREVSIILDYTLAASVMRGASEADIDDVFARINTYGHRLSDQERRQAGVQDKFSELIREIACELRGDTSADILTLSEMPAISIDLPMTKHGYEVIASEVFWVQQGILRSTGLRDSMDEQCIADVLACIVSGQLLPRSKDALDEIYDHGSEQNLRITAALETYGPEKIQAELKFCIDEILKVCEAGTPSKLRTVIFNPPTTNAFPAVFAVLLIAFHESLIAGKKKISNYEGVKTALSGLSVRVDTSRGSTSPDERRLNVDTTKGLISNCLVESDPPLAYGSFSTADIDSSIRRSQIELPNYELKQGLLRLDPTRAIDSGVFEKVIRTVCGIANNGRERSGTVIIGVTDNVADADRIRTIDSVEPKRVGNRFVVGVRREAEALGESMEDYVARWKIQIRNSDLSSPLRENVLSNFDFNDYFSLGIIIINVPPQSSLSYVGEKAYWRSGDETLEATQPRQIADLVARF
jgi:hypothetical protein